MQTIVAVYEVTEELFSGVIFNALLAAERATCGYAGLSGLVGVARQILADRRECRCVGVAAATRPKPTTNSTAVIAALRYKLVVVAFKESAETVNRALVNVTGRWAWGCSEINTGGTTAACRLSYVASKLLAGRSIT